MLLGVIFRVSFRFLGDFGENRKNAKTRKSGHYWASTSQRREPTPQCRPTPRRGIPLSRRGQGAKMALLGYATE